MQLPIGIGQELIHLRDFQFFLLSQDMVDRCVDLFHSGGSKIQEGILVVDEIVHQGWCFSSNSGLLLRA